jgi:outer membrane protein TolC
MSTQIARPRRMTLPTAAAPSVALVAVALLSLAAPRAAVAASGKKAPSGEAKQAMSSTWHAGRAQGPKPPTPQELAELDRKARLAADAAKRAETIAAVQRQRANAGEGAAGAQATPPPPPPPEPMPWESPDGTPPRLDEATWAALADSLPSEDLAGLEVPSGATAPPGGGWYPDTGGKTMEEFLAAYVPSDEEAARGAVLLPLDQALVTALEQELQLDTARLSAKSTAAQVDTARSAFDPLFSADQNHSDTTSPQATSLNADVAQSLNDRYSASWAQTLFYGGRYQVTLSANWNQTNNPFATVNPSYSTDLLLTYTQPLLRGLGLRYNKRGILQALNNAAIAGHDLRIQARSVVQRTIDAYWDLSFARSDLKVREASLQLAQNLLRRNKIMVEVGTLAPLEVTSAEAAVAQRSLDIIRARTAVVAAEDVVRQLLGIEEESPWWRVPLVPADRPEYEEVHADAEQTLATALREREEVKSATLLRENAEIDLAAAKHELKPQLDLNVTVRTDGLAGDSNEFIEDGDGDTVPDDADGDTVIEILPAVDDGYGDAFRQVRGTEFNSWTAGLSFSYPVFNRAAKAGYTIARLGVESAKIGTASARQAVTLEVRNALRTLESSREQFAAAQVSTQLQRKTLDAEVKKFENGLSTNLDVLRLQTDLQTAASAELRARIDYIKAIAALQQARGSILTDRGLTLEP